MKKISLKKPKLLSLKVTEILREAIIYGELKPGEKLNEAQLAMKLGISKSPLREALRNLESENLVETRSWKGTYIKKASLKGLEEIYLVLSMIEGTVARLAANNMDTKREKELKFILNEMEKVIEKGDIKRNVTLWRSLHDFIIIVSGIDLLSKIHNFLRSQELRFSMTATTGGDSLHDVYREHLAISEALLEKNGDQAEALMKVHIEKARLRALARLKRSEDGIALPDSGSGNHPQLPQ